MSVEDVCYVLSLLFHQAKEYFVRHKHAEIENVSSLRSAASLKLDEKSETQYREIVKGVLSRIRENPLRIVGGEFQAVTLILQTFYETSMASKYTRKILKPYLKSFFVKTYKNCWYLNEWRNYIQSDELMALRIFSRLVSENKMSCKAGLLDAAEKSK